MKIGTIDIVRTVALALLLLVLETIVFAMVGSIDNFLGADPSETRISVIELVVIFVIGKLAAESPLIFICLVVLRVADIKLRLSAFCVSRWIIAFVAILLLVQFGFLGYTMNDIAPVIALTALSAVSPLLAYLLPGLRNLQADFVK